MGRLPRGALKMTADERVTPHDLEAEKLVLGTILLHPERFAEAAAIVGPDDFFRTAHQRIFSHMRSIIERGDVLDFVLLRTSLANAGELDAVDGPAYITALVDGIPRGTNLPEHARLVKETARARLLVAYCEQAREEFSRDTSALSNGAGTRFADAVRRVVDDAHGSAVTHGLDPAHLTDAVDVVQEGQQLAQDGVRYVLQDLIPSYGMVGLLVAFAKTGKTTFGQAAAAAVAMGRPFLGRPTTQTRVLVIAAEDPVEYTAFLARNLVIDPQVLTFYRAPLILDAAGLARITATVTEGHYGLVLISTWQAVVRGLVKDENDNAGNAAVMESVKNLGARVSNVPWLIDAHSGKGEDQSDDADPSRAMRGATSVQGSADFTLSLRYDKSPFSTRRRLSGKGRFVHFAPLTLDYDPATGDYSYVGSSKSTMTDTTWNLIETIGAVTTTPRSDAEIAVAIGSVGPDGKPNTSHRRQVRDALGAYRDRVLKGEEMRRGQKTTVYTLL